MSTLMSEHHYLDGMALPIEWQKLAYYQRIAVCEYLRMKANSQNLSDFKMGRSIWRGFSPGHRIRIQRHLEAIGELKTRDVPYTSFAEYGRCQGKSVAAKMVQEAYEKAGLAPLIRQQEASRLHRDSTVAHPQITHVWIDEVSKMNKMLYERPNGGQRTLPSVYGRLRGNKWMRANGVIQDVEDMNDGHIENTLKLLQESHGNIQAKATSLLGKMHRHYQNQPEIQRRLEELCHLMEQVEVHQMYPIFGTLAQEQASRKPVGIVAGLDFDAFDDAVKDW